MPKINFDIPLLSSKGEPVMRTKVNFSKTKAKPDGRMVPEICTDEQGNAIQEPAIIRDIVVELLTSQFEGDGKVGIDQLLKRGKLARKVATSKEANYRMEELQLIQELAARAAQTLLLTQLDDIINGTEPETENRKSPSGEAA